MCEPASSSLPACECGKIAAQIAEFVRGSDALLSMRADDIMGLLQPWDASSHALTVAHHLSVKFCSNEPSSGAAYQGLQPAADEMMPASGSRPFSHYNNEERCGMQHQLGSAASIVVKSEAGDFGPEGSIGWQGQRQLLGPGPHLSPSELAEAEEHDEAVGALLRRLRRLGGKSFPIREISAKYDLQPPKVSVNVAWRELQILQDICLLVKVSMITDKAFVHLNG